MESLFYSLTHRWYVTVFLVAFLALSYMEQGKLRTLIWLVTGYLIAFLAEWGSINYGIPFGFYVYHADVLQHDLTIAGVPFFDSVSFAFLSYVGFSFAQFFMSPLLIRRGDVQRVTPRAVRNSASVIFLGALLMLAIDWVTDPVAHLGEHWFLGDIYHYPNPGHHFRITFANYIGWFVVGWAIIFVNQQVDSYLGAREIENETPVNLPWVPFKGLFAPLFWMGIVGFGIGITAYLGWWYEPSAGSGFSAEEVRKLFFASCFIVTPIIAIAALQLFKPSNHAKPEQVTAWLQDYPCKRLVDDNRNDKPSD
ncbi:carotenoid biosynthesis protein [Planctomycetota bacterium]|nr:carotenoid biosynthesis protein [Planctomycetota bacterium]